MTKKKTRHLLSGLSLTDPLVYQTIVTFFHYPYGATGTRIAMELFFSYNNVVVLLLLGYG